MRLVFTQILVILLYIAVGFVAGRTRLILPEQRKYLSMLCSNLILPFTILSASSQTVNGREMAGMLGSLMFMLAEMGLVTAASLAYHRARGASPARRAATTGLLTYSNCTFLGLPLCTALFGEMAILYNASAMIAYNVLFFTVQYSLFAGQVNLKKLITPSVLATAALLPMLAVGFHFPAPVQTVMSGIGSMISPLSLIIIGVMLSESRLMDVIGEKRSYLVAALRNLAIPLASMVFLKLLPLSPDARLCVLVYIACPCATLTSIYAIQYDAEPEYTANTVLLSTVLFAATLPVMIAAGQAYL